MELLVGMVLDTCTIFQIKCFQRDTLILNTHEMKGIFLKYVKYHLDREREFSFSDSLSKCTELAVAGQRKLETKVLVQLPLGPAFSGSWRAGVENGNRD